MAIKFAPEVTQSPGNVSFSMPPKQLMLKSEKYFMKFVSHKDTNVRQKTAASGLMI